MYVAKPYKEAYSLLIIAIVARMERNSKIPFMNQ